MPREAAIIFKRNDKQTAPGKEHLGLKHGDIVQVIDNAEFKDESLENLFSQQMREAFGIIQIDPKNVPLFKGYARDTGEDWEAADYRPRIKRVDVTKLAALTGVSDVNEKLYTEFGVPILNGLLLGEDDLIDATTMYNDIRFPDVKAITSGACTIGAGGAGTNYLTWVLFYADLAGLTGDITATQVNDTSETQAVITESLNSYTITHVSDTDHLGDATAGWISSLTTDRRLFDVSCEGSGDMIYEKLNLKRTTTAANGLEAFWRAYTIGTAFNLRIRRNIVNLNSLIGAGLRSQDNTPVILMSANMIFDASTGTGIQIDSSDGNASSVYENNSIHDMTDGVNMASNGGTLRNNAIMGMSSNAFENVGGATGYNNGTDDATGEDADFSTGSGNLSNLTIGDEWQSVTPSDGDTYLKPKSGGNIIDDGTTPTYATTLINGVAWTSEIGAKSKDTAAGIAVLRRRREGCGPY